MQNQLKIGSSIHCQMIDMAKKLNNKIENAVEWRKGVK